MTSAVMKDFLTNAQIQELERRSGHAVEAYLAMLGPTVIQTT